MKSLFNRKLIASRIFAWILIIVLPSCEDDFLTEVPKGFLSPENTFVNKDASNTLKLGQARGVCMLVPALAGIAVEEYAPNAIKKAVVGVGHASKQQIEYMVKLQLPKIQLKSIDSTDAIAVAICHANHIRNSMKMQKKMQYFF